MVQSIVFIPFWFNDAPQFSCCSNGVGLEELEHVEAEREGGGRRGGNAYLRYGSIVARPTTATENDSARGHWGTLPPTASLAPYAKGKSAHRG